ncbi:hypothetical protein SRHO_G00340850 [Serrasalmus rhombeus]
MSTEIRGKISMLDERSNQRSFQLTWRDLRTVLKFENNLKTDDLAAQLLQYDKAEILCRGGTAVSLKGICAQSGVQLFLTSVLTLLNVILHSHTALNPITLLTAAAMFTYCSSQAIVGPCLLRSFPVFAVQSMVRDLLRARPDQVTFSTAKIFHNLHDGLNP